MHVALMGAIAVGGQGGNFRFAATQKPTDAGFRRQRALLRASSSRRLRALAS